MRLVLPLPDGWKNLADLATGEPAQASQRISPLVEPRLTVHYGVMVPSPLDGESWMQEILGEELPAGCRLVEQRRAPNQTVTGYPMQIVYSTIVDAADKLVEARMTAFYAMLSYNAAAVLRIRAKSDGSDDSDDSDDSDGGDDVNEILARYDEPAKTLFRAASPDFQTGLCTIAALYDGLPGLWERK
jgi:hypothetical protein